MFEKVLVANRGEIAIRVFRTLRELGHRVGRGLLRARPRRAARRSAPTRPTCSAARPGRRELPQGRADPRGLRASPAPRRSIPATASWPRTPPSRRRCEDAGIIFIGPPAAAIEAMGSKTRARELMQAAGVPIVPGTTEPVATVEDARKMIDEEIGYPVAVKAAGGGGGKGFRVALDRGRARGRVRGRRARGREVLLRRDGLPRALPAGPAPRRGPGPRRPARQRHPPRRARLLGPAPPPEAHRGVAGAGRRRRAARAHRRRSASRPRARSATSARGRSRGSSRTASTSSSR